MIVLNDKEEIACTFSRLCILSITIRKITLQNISLNNKQWLSRKTFEKFNEDFSECVDRITVNYHYFTSNQPERNIIQEKHDILLFTNRRQNRSLPPSLSKKIRCE